MAKTSQRGALFNRLRPNGLLGRGTKRRASKAAQGPIGGLRKLVSVLGDRAKGGPGKRKAAAKKAAATRKRKAAQRSAAAKKAARTRATKSRS